MEASKKFAKILASSLLCIVLVASVGCGPGGKSIPKALLNSTNSDSESVGPVLFSDAAVNEASEDNTSDLITEETSYYSNQVSDIFGRSPYARELGRVIYRQIPNSNKIDIRDEELISQLRRAGDSIVLSHADFLPADEHEVRVRVLIELNRAPSEIAQGSLLPQAHLSIRSQGTGSESTQIITLSFQPGSDPTADAPEDILSDVRRIMIFRMPTR